MSRTEFKTAIDKLWDEFHDRGITNPISVIEQVSYLIFLRLLDIQETRAEKMAKRIKGRKHDPIFTKGREHLRWSNFRDIGKSDEMLSVVRDEVFPFLRNDLEKHMELGKYMRNAQCLIPNPDLMQKAVRQIEELELTKGDVKGDLYEYMLGKLTTAGIAGQFRTPRHIIAAMVEMIDPKPTETVCDPACGTAGFLVETIKYLYRTHTSEPTEGESGDLVYSGDLLGSHEKHIKNKMLTGFDFDATMLRISAMNLMLHDIQSPSIKNQDTLSYTFEEKFRKKSQDYFDVILANPPFKGSIDAEAINPALTSTAKTTKTELLFLINFVRMLKVGGRAAVVVPDGVLFGSSRAHLAVRQMLIDENQLEAVISLPSGVFKPYAGVSTAILIFSKGGRTDHVWFYGVANDGLSLDDKRDPLPEFLDTDKKIPGNDLPDLLAQWKKRDAKQESERTAKHFFVPVDEVRKNKYDLSCSRYHEKVIVTVDPGKPKPIIRKLRDFEKAISKDLDELEGMLK